MMFMFEHLKNSHINWLQIGPTNKLDIGTWYIDIAIKAKNSEGLGHKLPCKCYRFWPLVLWPLWEDFEKLAYSENFS